MKFGRFEIETINFGYFRLDGGSMFGSVPKNIWSKRIPADDQNRIRLATRCLVVRDGKRLFLVDVGMGDKWSEKERAIFAIEADEKAKPSFQPEEVTDLVLTHLHFDHAGGVSRLTAEGKPELIYKHAHVHLQHDNLENAKAPNVKERASYLRPNWEPLQNSNLKLVNGSVEIYPDFWVHQVDGHTRGQQWIELRSPERSLIYTTDLIPTSHHLPLPYHMGYDICAEKLLKEKDEFLARAVKQNSIVVFEHDAEVEAVTVKVDERGHYAVQETIALN
ncbi:MAG: MBL fold metallo-hydrolase [Oligoflexia bacterium]|nr:MBL fold metallo-hydrolase [Oligoflexia bacterium]